MVDTDTLPREPESEKYVLGCMIQFPDCWNDATKLLRPTDFVDPTHAAIFDVFSRQSADGGIDPVLAAREVKHLPFFAPDGNAAGYLYDLKENVATSVHVAHEAGKIVGARRKRQRIQFAESLRKHAQDGYRARSICQQGVGWVGRHAPRDREHGQTAICRNDCRRVRHRQI